jgi:SAM-dependent methyltransferase
MWQQRYDRPEYVFGEAPNAFLRDHADLLKPGAKVLCLADGEGRNGVFLAERGCDVLSMDFSGHALQKAEALSRKRGVTLRLEEADVTQWRFPEEGYDVVVAIFIQFLPPAQRDALFANIRKTLRPGGLLLLQGYRPEQIANGTGGPPQVENLYTRQLLEAEFAGFTCDIKCHDTEIHEGVAHGGMSALIDLVAWKPAVNSNPSTFLHGADFMNLDRAVLAFAGLMILVSLILTYFVSPWFWLFTAFIGLNLLQAAFTGFCPAALVFKHFGVPSGCVFK